MVNLAVCGLALTSLLFFVPSFIFLNVGFRCAISSSLDDGNRKGRTYCVRVDLQLSHVLIGSGFVFFCVGLANVLFAIAVHYQPKYSGKEELESLGGENIQDL